MTAFSRSPGPALQRHAEDCAALASELVAADAMERTDLDELDRLLRARPFTGVSLVKARRLSQELISLNNVEDPAHVELLAIERLDAGEWERWNAAQFAAMKKAPSPSEASPEPKQRVLAANQSTTNELQLPLFGESE